MLSKRRVYRMAGGFFVAITMAAGAVIPVQLPMSRPGSIPPAKKQLTQPLTQGARRTPGQNLANIIQHLTPEQRKKLAKVLKKMKPEERAQLLNSLSARVGAVGRGVSPVQRRN